MKAFQRFGVCSSVMALSAVLLVGACGGGGGGTPDGGGGTTGSSGGTTGGGGTGGTIGSTGGTTGAGGAGGPVASCKGLASSICNRGNSCTNAGLSADDLATCINEYTVAFSCDNAVSAGYATCLSDFNALSCSSDFASDGTPQLPTACDDPMTTTPPTDAQNKCGDLATAFCNREFDCANIAAPSTTDMQNCKDDYYYNLLVCPLATTVGTTAALTQCEAEIGKLPCPSADGGTADAGADVDGGSALPSCDTAITFAP
ncbi:MAG TPA: hypothetical protein VHJ20_08905 [Polyangia bacterium]|nr:hypothetical protein [Polyangia bacterium]